MIDSMSKGNWRKEIPELDIAYRELTLEIESDRSRMFAEAEASAHKLELMRQALDQREEAFERRIKFYLLCYCAIASCVGVLVGAATFLLMGVIY